MAYKSNWRETHKQIYIALSVLIFALVGIVHALRLINHWQLSLGLFSVPYSVSAFAVAIAVLMLVMGGYYLLHK